MNGQLVHYEAYTPMAYDIQAVQYLYGANPTTEFGATTFTFTPSTPRVQAIYDTGGIDAIDLSNFALRSVVDLTPWASSTFGYTHHIDDNTAIAFGSIIENVFSGSGSDDVFGNDADNEIHAGAGDDLVTVGQAMTRFWGNPITTRYLVERETITYLAAMGMTICRTHGEMIP